MNTPVDTRPNGSRGTYVSLALSKLVFELNVAQEGVHDAEGEDVHAHERDDKTHHSLAEAFPCESLRGHDQEDGRHVNQCV